MQNLASDLRTELFVRSGKRLVATPAAFRLADHARGVLHQVRELEHDFKNDPATDTRPFAFATGATTLIHRLGRPLRLLRKRYPKTEIHVTVAPTEEILAGLTNRAFDLGLISLPVHADNMRILPLFEEELLLLRPSAVRVRSGHVGTMQASELAAARFLLYPKRSNMRSIIDGFFSEIGIAPRVVMEADDTEAIKRLVESGFGSSILPEFALRGGTHFFHKYRIAGHRLIRRQALAMVKTEYPRALTESVAEFLQKALTREENGD
jgi:LysR family nitrogen assimilation transcriptional regulator